MRASTKARLTSLLGLLAGGAALAWILSSVGLDAVMRGVVRAGWALPAVIAVHAVQLFLSGCGWREALGVYGLGRWRILRIRWIREGVNSLFPVAQIGGQVVGVRLLVQAGLAPTLAVAGTILDLTLEAASQVVVILVAIAILLLREGDRSWLVWAEAGLGATALAVAVLFAAQRLGLLRLVETGLQHAAARWPATMGWSMQGLHATLMQRQADRGAMLRAALMHAASWSLGALEVWLILRALGAEVGLGPAFVIETLAMAARSAGFAVPGAVGVQEGGFVLACGLFGIDAETALALSVVKRLREVTVGAAAVLAWQIQRPAPMPEAVPRGDR